MSGKMTKTGLPNKVRHVLKAEPESTHFVTNTGKINGVDDFVGRNCDILQILPGRI